MQHANALAESIIIVRLWSAAAAIAVAAAATCAVDTLQQQLLTCSMHLLRNCRFHRTKLWHQSGAASVSEQGWLCAAFQPSHAPCSGCWPLARVPPHKHQMPDVAGGAKIEALLCSLNLQGRVHCSAVQWHAHCYTAEACSACPTVPMQH